MYTYQDFLLVPDNEEERMAFVKRAIDQHKTTELYKTAIIADEYDRHRNRTIMEYQKILYDVLGRAVPDVWTANYKLPSRFFNRFVTQENQYLLGNGVTWTDDATSIECLRNDTKETLNQRTTADADTIAKVTIALTTGCIVMTYLSEVAWALSVVHLIHDITHQQLMPP